MTISIIIPEINVKPKSTKDAVINILALEWPLSLRGIFYKIKSKYGYSSSYQAVFNAVKELAELKVLVKKDKKYEINTEWIKRVQSFTDIVETNYYAKERVYNLFGIKDSKQKSDIIVLNFDTIFDAEKYLYYLMKSELFKTKNDIICWNLSAEWRPIFYLRSEYNYYKRLIKKGHKFYFLCSENSELERLSGKFYKAIGVNFKVTDEKFSNDVLVFGDSFVSIFIPETLKAKMRKLIGEKNIMNLLKEVLDYKSSIRVVINKDSSLAKELKKQAVKKFLVPVKASAKEPV